MAKHILVVDDDTVIRSMMKIMLEGEGHSVVSAASGSEALDLCGNEKFDLLFLDVMLPGKFSLRASVLIAQGAKRHLHHDHRAQWVRHEL